MPLPFLVVTRLGVGIHNETWFDSVLGLFEAITFPSLVALPGADFTALIVVDSGMPASARSRLSGIIRERDNFHVVAVDLTAMQSVRQGCFDYIWDACQDYLLTQRVITNPFDYVITSVLDAGDAWHRSTVALVRNQIDAELPEFLASEHQNLTWSKHSGGLYFSFPDGLEWYVQPDIVLPVHLPYHGSSAFVAARFSSGISAAACRHSVWPSYCNALSLKSIVPEACKPMWVYGRHDRAEVSWEAPDILSDPKVAQLLSQEFGIDFDKVAEWRKNHAPPLGADNNLRTHKGMPSAEQLDCGLRISTLGRQIAALECQLKAGALDSEGEELLARQRSVRIQLERLYRERARSNFG
jgi:hypothetical protein